MRVPYGAQARGVIAATGLLLWLPFAVGASVPAAALAASTPSDSLYVGDAADNTVKRFDAVTGQYLGSFIHGSGLHGPRGILRKLNLDNLLVSDQNAATSIPGEIDQYSAQTGKFLGALVPHSDNLNAPYAPRGIIIAPDNGTLYVADMGPDFPDCVEPCGAVKQFDVNTGQFRGNLHFTTVNGEFRPRGLVFGPDGLLYVSLFSERDPTVGFVVSYNRATGVDKLVASYTTESDCTKHLHRPEGLAFGPDGSLYVTTFRKDSTDIDRILIFNRRTGACLDEIDLDQPAQPRAFAQALVFGPGGSLVVPITGNGPDTGAVRLYDVTKKTFPFTNFLPPSMDAGPLGSPWYLSFGKTSPVTLTYRN